MAITSMEGTSMKKMLTILAAVFFVVSVTGCQLSEASEAEEIARKNTDATTDSTHPLDTQEYRSWVNNFDKWLETTSEPLFFDWETFEKEETAWRQQGLHTYQIITNMSNDLHPQQVVNWKCIWDYSHMSVDGVFDWIRVMAREVILSPYQPQEQKYEDEWKKFRTGMYVTYHPEYHYPVYAQRLVPSSRPNTFSADHIEIYDLI